MSDFKNQEVNMDEGGFSPEVNTATDAIKCKGCGSNMTFDPETQMMKCSYCEYTESFAQSAQVAELDINSALASNAVWDDEAVVFRCENCGAKIVGEKGQTASLCPFCGTSHVITDEDLKGIRPNAVVPFTFTAEAASSNFRTWVKKKLFAPRAFKKTARAEATKGVYMPYFTFDSNTQSVYEGRVGYTRTRTVRTKNGTRTETYTVWKNIRGTLEHFFDDILINAGSNSREKHLHKIEPFDFGSAKVYESNFLSGFLASHYERDIRTCWEDARKEMDATLRNMIISRYNCDKVGYLNVSTRHNGVTFKYVMLPVYVITTNYKRKSYTVYQNGSTGKFSGKIPVSVWRVLAAVGLGLVAVAGLVALIYYGLVV